ncbi:EamA family transporter RarD [Pseudomonas indica]|uniref:EamA family transporter RarD n=1 Tax=Pseudomonas indica TaxID=137658 RepID=UPI000BABF9B0|nr:EamA family transporter RarD [Pseudomonas indica]MBU3058357.1 EamA family transporter RarD [Pseudomonas indica]PAU62460.1 chemotaxis protein [Pseudomonas indica]
MFKGIALSVASSCAFAGLYYYATLLKPLTGEAIFGWRMLLTLPCVTLFLLLGREWQPVREICARLRQRPTLLIGLIGSSALLGVQQWLFLWAPINGRALQVSLGYFLLPLVMLMVGLVFYRERLTGLQKAASVSAVLGVAHEWLQMGGFSWEALLVALGFPAYFMLRRKLDTANLGGLWFDMLFTLPFACWFVLGQQATAAQFEQAPRLYLLVVFLAVISAAAFMAYTTASRLLPFSLFGLLGYVEPVLMVIVALLIGERIEPHEWLTYLPIWLAVALLAVEGAWHLRQKPASESGAG